MPSIVEQPIPLLAGYAIETQAHQYPWTENVFQSCLNERYLQFCVLADNQLAGYLIAQQIADEVTLMNIAVAPAFQRQGLARQLLETLAQRSRTAAATSIWLEVRASNQSAIRLYQQTGFTEAGRRRNYYPLADGQEDALVMQCLLS